MYMYLATFIPHFLREIDGLAAEGLSAFPTPMKGYHRPLQEEESKIISANVRAPCHSSSSLRASKPVLAYPEPGHHLIHQRLLLFHHNLLGHAVDDFAVKPLRMVSRETDFFGQVVWQQIQELSVAAFV